MTALPPDAVADLYKLVAELEQRLESSFAAHDAAIARQAATDAENTRLIGELSVARERRNAVADILSTIAHASGDADRALYQIAETSARLFGAPSATIQIAEGDGWARTIRVGESSKRVGAGVPETLLKIGGRNMPGTIVGENRQVHVPDVDNVDPEIADWPGLPYVREAGTRSMSGSPLRLEGKAIGALIVYRDELAPFTDDELALQQSFADQAAIAIENSRLFNETKEALERQTATSEILKVIASSPSDVQPVFEAIAASAKRLLGGFSTTVLRFIGDELHLVAYTPTDPAADETLKATFPRLLAEFPTFALVRNGETVQFADTETDDVPEPNKELARLRGFRSVLFTPLMNQGTPVGMISVTRAEPGAFASHHTQLLQTFADQAVIAIENVRLFNETQEALERQTATAEILRVIASSPSDAAPVFEAIAHSAKRLLGGFSAAVFRYVDGFVHLAAFTPTKPTADEALRADFPTPVEDFAAFRLARQGEPFAIPDTEELSHAPVTEIARKHGFRSMLWVPMVNAGVTIGVLSATRVEPGAFASHHTQLLQTFADQAVIAIANARLFNEVKQRTEDLSESLQQQTAVGDVLKTISRSTFDLQPVLDTLVNTAALLCDAEMAFIMRREGEEYRAGAAVGFSRDFIEFLETHPLKADRGSITGRAVLERRTIQILDVATDPEYTLRESTTLGRQHTAICVPLLREDEPIGTIVLARQRVEAFTQKQIDLVTTFADQAVIAIENVRLFDEVRQRTEDLSESLQQQTATADVLKVISRSAFDLQKVLDTLSESAAGLCEAEIVIIHRRVGEGFRGAASFGLHEEHHRAVMEIDHKPGRGSLGARVLFENAPVLIEDAESEPDYEFALQQRVGLRSMMGVPLLREGVAIGLLLLFRKKVRPFTERHVELAMTFADQAVIAIENVRLFDEVQARTRDLTESLQQQTATADVLKVISRSAFDLQTVLDTLVESAAQLCDADRACVFKKTGELFHWVSNFGFSDELIAYANTHPFTAGPHSTTSRVALEGKAIHNPDVLADPDYKASEYQRLGNYRTMLGIPLLREGAPIGVFILAREQVRPFTDRQIELVTSFADQAVIAIENVRLFDEVQARTRELATSLDDLRTAQDRLVQTEKLASLGQLTAGIAHEIKNPLNFVNNFAALSMELTDELNDLLKPADLAEKARAEVDELTGLLKDNLQKVVQHGKRADSIVKNMLLHSREGSGDHRPADINALIDESLNLAYHGARAERPDFNVTLQRDFDADAGMVEVFPQEITRVFLNLVSNGFYAVAKRKTGDSGFDPILSATTRNLGDSVEIRIRDNGTGIPPEVKDKMFNPFFTTKPAGEGTGLGLSMSHDIIVKQHGGTIDVETQPGQFTEFRIVLPRTSHSPNKTRGQS